RRPGDVRDHAPRRMAGARGPAGPFGRRGARDRPRHHRRRLSAGPGSESPSRRARRGGRGAPPAARRARDEGPMSPDPARRVVLAVAAALASILIYGGSLARTPGGLPG